VGAENRPNTLVAMPDKFARTEGLFASAKMLELGDVVNTASRIEKASRAYSVLVSEATLDKIRDPVTTGKSFSQKVKGKQKEIMLHFLKSIEYASAGEKRRLEI